MDDKKTYVIEEVTTIDQVPDWQRREPKWDDLKKVVRNLKPGQSLPVRFPTVQEAKNARNAVRDGVNDDIGAALIGTRLIKLKDGQARTHFFRVPENEQATDTEEEETVEEE
jgi:hypothetical protein